jgi:hypothetical protein
VTLSELITKYGDDIQFQNLDQCAKSLDFHHKNGTTITFGTEMNIHAAKGTEKLGLVVWMDRARVAEIISAPKEEDRP